MDNISYICNRVLHKFLCVTASYNEFNHKCYTAKRTVTVNNLEMAATKAVAARLPMEEYLKFQKEAVEKKMSMNDYMIMRIYEGEKSKEEIDTAKAEAQAAMAIASSELEKAKVEAEKIKSEAEKLKAEAQEMKVNAVKNAQAEIDAKVKEKMEASKPTEGDMLLLEILGSATKMVEIFSSVESPSKSEKDSLESWKKIATQTAEKLSKDKVAISDKPKSKITTSRKRTTRAKTAKK